MLKIACQFVRRIRPLAGPHMSYGSRSVSGMEFNWNPLLKKPFVPVGEILTDYAEQKWQVKEFLGGSRNGGNVYKVSLVDSIQLPPQSVPQPPQSVPQHAVVKMENPMHDTCLEMEIIFFAELQAIAKDWVKSQKLEYLPILKWLCDGSHGGELENSKQFIVFEEYGISIAELLKRSANGKFNTKTICYIALRMLEALECIHSIGYSHANINGSNILIGYSSADKHKVYLIDYRMVIDYTHKEDFFFHRPEDHNIPHWGTVVYTSIDVHNGEHPVRRGDMEILGYNIMEWAGVKIPWLEYSDDKASTIAVEKKKFRFDLLAGGKPISSIMAMDGAIPEYILTYMRAVYKMEYLEKPDYESLKNIFRKTLDENNLKDDKNDLDWTITTTE